MDQNLVNSNSNNMSGLIPPAHHKSIESLRPIKRINSAKKKQVEDPSIQIDVVSGQLVAEAQVVDDITHDVILEEEAPWYGKKRYEIVDQIIQQEQDKMAANNISEVKRTVQRAQAPYMTMSMAEIAQNYTGPTKYLHQRDAPMEIP